MIYAGIVDYSTIGSGVVTEATSAISSVAPLAVPVLGAIVGIGIAIKVVRKLAK